MKAERELESFTEVLGRNSSLVRERNWLWRRIEIISCVRRNGPQELNDLMDHRKEAMREADAK